MKIFEIWNAIEKGKQMQFSDIELKILMIFMSNNDRLTLEEIKKIMPVTKNNNRFIIRKALICLNKKGLLDKQRREIGTNKYIKPVYFLKED